MILSTLLYVISFDNLNEAYHISYHINCLYLIFLMIFIIYSYKKYVIIKALWYKHFSILSQHTYPKSFILYTADMTSKRSISSHLNGDILQRLGEFWFIAIKITSTSPALACNWTINELQQENKVKISKTLRTRE